MEQKNQEYNTLRCCSSPEWDTFSVLFCSSSVPGSNQAGQTEEAMQGMKTGSPGRSLAFQKRNGTAEGGRYWKKLEGQVRPKRGLVCGWVVFIDE
jgi:hypothetical protein